MTTVPWQGDFLHCCFHRRRFCLRATPCRDLGTKVLFGTALSRYPVSPYCALCAARRLEMLNGTVLDVAVGLIFIYLMLSVACSLLNERIQSMLDTRARMLEVAIRKLLGGEQNSPFDGVKD